MTEAERAELTEMLHGLCFDGRLSCFCTEPKGHEGPHVCTSETVDRYFHLRYLARSEWAQSP